MGIKIIKVLEVLFNEFFKCVHNDNSVSISYVSFTNAA
jgi:hypothetical protein